LQSAGVDGTTILRPGTWKNSASTLCEWYIPPCTPAPNGARITIGQVYAPLERYRILAASLTIWS
jgi:hypothetical protein